MASARNKENQLVSLAINIFLPVIILQKLGPRLGPNGPLIALLLGLSLPLFYGAYQYFKQKKFSWMAALGLISVFSSGIFSVLQLTGRWFILKEGLLPLVLGCGVLATSWSQQPFIKTLFFQPEILHTEKILSQLEAQNLIPRFHQLLRQTTILFSLSFILSSGLNFWLAAKIFVPIDASVAEASRQQLMNDQIAQMTWQSQIVIVVPLMIFSVLVMVFFLRRLAQLSQLKMDDLFATNKK